MRTLVGIAALGVLVLTACGQKSETKAASAQAPQAATASPANLAAPAWPKRRPGLWIQTMNVQGFSRSFRFCVDQTSDQKMGLNTQGADPQCRQTSMTRGLDGDWTIVSACDLGAAGKTDSTVRVSGDFNTRYVMDVATATTGAAQPAMNGAHKMAMTAQWSGACPEGWSGGDVEMPGGRRINLVTKRASGG